MQSLSLENNISCFALFDWIAQSIFELVVVVLIAKTIQRTASFFKVKRISRPNSSSCLIVLTTPADANNVSELKFKYFKTNSSSLVALSQRRAIPLNVSIWILCFGCEARHLPETFVQLVNFSFAIAFIAFVRRRMETLFHSWEPWGSATDRSEKN